MGTHLQEVHKAVSAVLQTATSTMVSTTHSKHVLRTSVTLASLREALLLAGKGRKNVFVGSINSKLVLSVHEGVKTCDAGENPRPRKRKLCPYEESAEIAIAALKGLTSDKKLEAARVAIVQMLKNVRGVDGEIVVKKWSLSLEEAAQKKNLVLSVQMAAGVAIPLTPLLESFAVATDGMLSTRVESKLTQHFEESDGLNAFVSVD